MQTPECPREDAIVGSPYTRRDALAVLGGALALPFAGGGLALAEGAMPRGADVLASAEMPPDLPNFSSLMDWVSREHAPKLSFLDSRWAASDFDSWKTEARTFLRAKLSHHPKPEPMTAELVHREEREGFSVEQIRIRATPVYQIPAWVLVPKNKRSARLPAVLALHCHSGRYTWGHEKVISASGEAPFLTTFRAGNYGRPWAEELARRGMLVIAIDAFYFGERRLRVEDIPAARVFSEAKDYCASARTETPRTEAWHNAVNRACGFYEHITAKTIFAAGATWPGLHVWDEMRTVDYLCSRPDVDPQRIGCAGLSGGGFRTAMAIASDPRIKAACVTGWMTLWAQQLRNKVRHTWQVFVPGLYSGLDLPDAAALHAPGALLVQQCRRDKLYPMEGMQGAVDKLAKIYAKAGMPERFRGTFYDEPHSFVPAMQEEAFSWLERWL